MLGDTTSFYIGRRLGRGFLEKHGPRVKITHERLEQVEGYFDRHGGKTILIGRFIGLVRALAPFIAGSSGLRYRRFIPYSIVGCGAVGHALLRPRLHLLALVRQGRSTSSARRCSGSAVLVAVIVGAVAGVPAARRDRRLARRAPSATRSSSRCSWSARRCSAGVVRPLVRVVAPPAAVRLRPAHARRARAGAHHARRHRAASGCTSSSGTSWSSNGDLGPTPFDSELLDLAHAPARTTAGRRGQGGHGLGSFPTVLAIVLATGVLVISRRASRRRLCCCRAS